VEQFRSRTSLNFNLLYQLQKFTLDKVHILL